jgi:DNA-directed RNA polymerase alpha subunit
MQANENILDQLVRDLPLSTRPINALIKDPGNGLFGTVIYVGELVQHTKAELLRRPYFGPKCLDEVVAVLGDLGLALQPPK